MSTGPDFSKLGDIRKGIQHLAMDKCLYYSIIINSNFIKKLKQIRTRCKI